MNNPGRRQGRHGWRGPGTISPAPVTLMRQGRRRQLCRAPEAAARPHLVAAHGRHVVSPVATGAAHPDAKTTARAATLSDPILIGTGGPDHTGPGRDHRRDMQPVPRQKAMRRPCPTIAAGDLACRRNPAAPLAPTNPIRPVTAPGRRTQCGSSSAAKSDRACSPFTGSVQGCGSSRRSHQVSRRPGVGGFFGLVSNRPSDEGFGFISKEADDREPATSRARARALQRCRQRRRAVAAACVGYHRRNPLPEPAPSASDIDSRCISGGHLTVTKSPWA